MSIIPYPSAIIPAIAISSDVSALIFPELYTFFIIHVFKSSAVATIPATNTGDDVDIPFTSPVLAQFSTIPKSLFFPTIPAIYNVLLVTSSVFLVVLTVP